MVIPKFTALWKNFKNTLFSLRPLHKVLKLLLIKVKNLDLFMGNIFQMMREVLEFYQNIESRRYFEHIWFPKKNRKFCIYNENKESKKFEQLGKIINFLSVII